MSSWLPTTMVCLSVISKAASRCPSSDDDAKTASSSGDEVVSSHDGAMELPIQQSTVSSCPLCSCCILVRRQWWWWCLSFFIGVEYYVDKFRPLTCCWREKPIDNNNVCFPGCCITRWRQSWGCSSILSYVIVVGLSCLPITSLMLYIHVELYTVGKLHVVCNVRAALTSFVDTSGHCGYAKMKFIGAVSLMYVFMQNVDVQPFVVEGGFADRCLKWSENKMTNTLPPDVVRQDLAHIANEWAITGPTTSSCNVPVKIWTIIVGSPKHEKHRAIFFDVPWAHSLCWDFADVLYQIYVFLLYFFRLCTQPYSMALSISTSTFLSK